MTGPEQDEYLAGLNAQEAANAAMQAETEEAEAEADAATRAELRDTLDTLTQDYRDLISAMARTLEDCRTRIVGYDFDTAALQAKISELIIRAEKCK